MSGITPPTSGLNVTIPLSLYGSKMTNNRIEEIMKNAESLLTDSTQLKELKNLKTNLTIAIKKFGENSAEYETAITHFVGYVNDLKDSGVQLGGSRKSRSRKSRSRKSRSRKSRSRK